MNIVRVKIDTENEKPRWLKVPEEFVKDIHKDEKLLCEVKGGITTGHATSEVMSGDGIEDLLSQKTSHFDDLKVLGVFKMINMDEIKICELLKCNPPRAEKIAKRINEIYEHGFFDTNVEINKDGYLMDGYTAYLVSKMFDYDVLWGVKTCCPGRMFHCE